MVAASAASLPAAAAGALATAALAPAAGDPDPCSAAAAADLKDYDVHAHVVAIFILLVVSLAGALAPVAVRLSSSRPGVTTAIRLGSYFGFGTILATAFVHMLAPAAEALSSPCLPAAFRQAYDAWAFLLATAAILVMHLVDYSLKGHYRARAQQQQQQQQPGSPDFVTPPSSPHAHEQQPAHAHSHSHLPGAGHEHEHGTPAGGCCHAHQQIIGALVSKERRAAEQQQAAEADAAADAAEAGEAASSSGSESEALDCLASGDLCTPLLQRGGCSSKRRCSGGGGGGHRHRHRRGGGRAAQLGREASQVVGLYLTEAGIIFHSVVIGLTLGVTAGAGFRTLLLALSLHQFFEGLAIGSAAVDSGLAPGRAALMGAAFAVTTPLGIGLGILFRESVAASAGLSLLASGVCDAVSAGILIFVSLVSMLSPQFTDSEWLRRAPGAVRAAAFACLYAGAAVMCVIGKWV